MATQDEKTKKLRKKFTGQEPDKEDGFDKKSFLETMRKRHDRLVKEDRENRDAAVEDQKFRRAGVKDQWDSQELTRRKKMLRPAIVLDELSRPINQVTGEMRLNKAHIQVVPADDDASLQVAKAYKDLIHEIEYDSKADRIYQYAGDMQECSRDIVMMTPSVRKYIYSASRTRCSSTWILLQWMNSMLMPNMVSLWSALRRKSGKNDIPRSLSPR